MKNTDKKHGFEKNFKNNNGENRKALRKCILNDKEWVQAFLQAQLDMREFRSHDLLKSVAF
tara:strand:- start:145 stop:327 length:183 start_codon:yes stop_codon:yes gene_type:complete